MKDISCIVFVDNVIDQWVKHGCDRSTLFNQSLLFLPCLVVPVELSCWGFTVYITGLFVC